MAIGSRRYLDKIGKRYAPVLYAVGREKVREYAARGGRDQPAPPRPRGRSCRPGTRTCWRRRCSSSSTPAGRSWAALFDPELEIDFAHARARRPGVPLGGAGGRCRRRDHDDADRSRSISERAGLRFYMFESVSVNQRGETTCVGTWSTIVRGRSELSGLRRGRPGSSCGSRRTRYVTVRYAGASGDFNPIHIDEEFALQVGLPGRILHGLWSMAQVARAATDAAGGPIRPAGCDCARAVGQFRGMGRIGEEIVVSGAGQVGRRRCRDCQARGDAGRDAPDPRRRRRAPRR